MSLARELAFFALLMGFAYAFVYAGAELTGWRRNLVCLAVATAMWCAIWTAIALGAPPNAAARLSSMLLIFGPVIIAWGVALALWRIDLEAEGATS